MRSEKAFTLIELLVVVAIIVALLAILLPSMNRAIYAAEVAVCRSNLHQMGTSLLSYRADNFASFIGPHKGWRPNQVAATNVGGFDIRDAWEPYIDDVNVLYCPLNRGYFHPERQSSWGSYPNGWDSTNGWAHTSYAVYPGWNYGNNYNGGPAWTNESERVDLRDTGGGKVVATDLTMQSTANVTMLYNWYNHAADNGVNPSDAMPNSIDSANRLFLDGSVDGVAYDEWTLRVNSSTSLNFWW